MERISFLNGQFLAHDKAFIHIEDRGFQFGDGVYEVILFQQGKLVDFEEHINRLFYSLEAIQIETPLNKDELKKLCLELFTVNNMDQGSVYLQITRGVAARQQGFPDKAVKPTIVANVSNLKTVDNKDLEKGFSAITYPDIRWERCDIKSISLLGNTLAKQKANSAKAAEAILIKDNYVTEGSFSNVFIVDQNQKLITREPNNFILRGITRNRIIKLAVEAGIEVIERKFSEEELLEAKEVFVTSSTLKIRPISSINHKIIGPGHTGVLTRRLIGLYESYINQQ